MMLDRIRPFRIVTPLLLVATACSPAARGSAPAALLQGEAVLRERVADRLYFGRAIPTGGTVSEPEWTAFLREVVTPRFPDGLTVWRAEGQWRGATGEIVREESFVLELIHAPGPGAEAAIREIVEEYRRRFAQESVLRVQHRVRVGY